MALLGSAESQAWADPVDRWLPRGVQPDGLLMIYEGDRAPGFRLRRVGGGTVSLKDYRGRPVLLVFLRHPG